MPYGQAQIIKLRLSITKSTNAKSQSPVHSKNLIQFRDQHKPNILGREKQSNEETIINANTAYLK